MDLLGTCVHVATGVGQVRDDFIRGLVDPGGLTAGTSSYRNAANFVDGEQTVQTRISITTPYDGVDVLLVATASGHGLTGFQRHTSHLGGSDFVDVVVVRNAYGLDSDGVLFARDVGLRQVGGTSVDYLGLTDTVEGTIGQGAGTGTAEGVGLEAGASFQVRIEDVIGRSFDGFELTLEEDAVIVGQAGVLVDQARDVSTQGHLLFYTSFINEFYFTGHLYSLESEKEGPPSSPVNVVA